MKWRFVQILRNHWPVLLIVPLVVIVTTWPTFPRIFDADEFWLHVSHQDKWLKFWDAWHFGQVLNGQADLYHSDYQYHPQGLSLAFRAFIFPHALLMVALETILPADDAYNLLYLLILCFNGFCGYLLISHLMKDKWIALYGTIVIVTIAPTPYGSTVPDLTMIGTLPLTLYFFHRFLSERRARLAGFAGICAGITPFISVYVFAIIALSIGIVALLQPLSRWKQLSYWLGLLAFAVACGSVSMLRFYPMLQDQTNLRGANEIYAEVLHSTDLLEHFSLSSNPISGAIFGAIVDTNNDFETSSKRREYKNAYLGYINLFLIACAFVLSRRRRKLLPWFVILIFFSVLRLGDYLTFNGIEYEHIVLPAKLLRIWFPPLFGNIGRPEYWQIGAVMPLAALACFGFASLAQSKLARTRMRISILFIFILCLETFVPRLGEAIEPDKTAFTAQLQSNPDHPVRLINLPIVRHGQYFLFVQTLTGLPHAYGHTSRIPDSTRHYVNGNLLLRSWLDGQNAHCLAHNLPEFTAALEQLEADGFTHIVVHKWLYGDQFIIHSFENIPAAYDDGSVSIYHVEDMRLSCQNQAAELPRFIHFAQSALAIPGRGSAILSLHPSQAIDPDLFDYLGSLFFDWASLLHLYPDNSELATQNSGKQYARLKAFIEDNQIVQVLYNTNDGDPDLLIDETAFDGFGICQREAHDDGAVIELYVGSGFSCELVTTSAPFQIQYDNGIRLENLEIQTDQDVVDFQFMWSGLPDEAHSISLQVFDAAGEKILGQDSVIGHLTLDRQRIDISSLPPGDYRVKLILYNFDTGAIVSGTASRDGARVERALEVAAISQS